MNKQELAKKIYEVAYLTGDFTLRSGQKSNEYFDKYRFESDPEILKSIAQHMSKLIPSNTEVLAGLELGGVPIATALSLATGLPCAFVRKEAKTYGTCQVTEGVSIKNKQVCIIEDVITTGGQVILSTKDLRELGAKVENVLCVIHRGTGHEAKLSEAELKMTPLFTMEELKSYFSATK